MSDILINLFIVKIFNYSLYLFIDKILKTLYLFKHKILRSIYLILDNNLDKISFILNYNLTEKIIYLTDSSRPILFRLNHSTIISNKIILRFIILEKINLFLLLKFLSMNKYQYYKF